MQYVTVPMIGTSEYNAIVMPNGVIAVTVGLKELLTEAEMEAILLHEKGHQEEKHVQTKMFYNFVVTTLWVIVLKKKGFKKGMLFNLFCMIPQTLMNWGCEAKADSYVVNQGGDVEALISALEKIDAANGMNVGWKQALGCLTHPPTVIRAARLREEAAALRA